MKLLLLKEHGMDRSLFKNCILLITYTIILILAVVKIDWVLSFITNIFIILSPFLIGIMIAFILNRPAKFFQRIGGAKGKKHKKAVKIFSLFMTYLLLISLLAGIVAVVIPQFKESLNMFYANLGIYTWRLRNLVGELFEFLHVQGIDTTGLEEFIRELPSLSFDFSAGFVPRLLDLTASAVSWTFNILLGLFLSIYLLADKDRLKRQFSKLITAYFSSGMESKIKHVYNVTNRTFGSFVVGQLTEALILGLLCFLGMLLFGFRYPVLISVVITVTSLIPFVGAFIGAFIGAFLLLLVEPIQALWFIIFIIVIQQIEGNFIYPKVVGDSVGLPGLWVLLAIIVGGGLFGVVGVLLSVPTAAVFYQLLREDVNSKLNKI
jgi:predicted PurR-regulated permease PerM